MNSFVKIAQTVVMTLLMLGTGSAQQSWFLDPHAPRPKELQEFMTRVQCAIRQKDTATAARLSKRVYPSAARVRQALRREPEEALRRAYHRLKPNNEKDWAGIFQTDPKRTEVSFYHATTEEMQALTDIVHREFPGGAVRYAHTHLKPGVRFYEIEITEPDAPAGMNFHLFFWDGEDWCMLGPIWRLSKPTSGGSTP